jgi:hypothetical protein
MKIRKASILFPVLMVVVLIGLLLFVQNMAADETHTNPAVSNKQNTSSALEPSAGWSSGWVSIPLGTCETFNHNLGGDPNDYAVELWFLDTAENNDLGWGINRYAFGGLEYGTGTTPAYWRGVHWEKLDANKIVACRGANDIAADRVRIRVWDLPVDPDYDSGWTDIERGIDNTLTFSHNLGITATDLTVSLWFSGTEKGVHQYAYGGLADNPDLDDPKPEPAFHGAFWHDLDENTVKVRRERDDDYVEQVRVVVVHSAPPDYDSLVDRGGWQPVGLFATETFTHGLNWSPRLLTVRAECRHFGLGIHHKNAGAIFDSVLGWQGAFIHSLGRNTVEVDRLPNDSSCSEVRVRIWKRGAVIFLPLVVRGS